MDVLRSPSWLRTARACLTTISRMGTRKRKRYSSNIMNSMHEPIAYGMLTANLLHSTIVPYLQFVLRGKGEDHLRPRCLRPPNLPLPRRHNQLELDTN